MLHGDSEGWKAIRRPLGHDTAQAGAVRNGQMSGDVPCSGYARRPLMASGSGKTHRQTIRCSYIAQMHARFPCHSRVYRRKPAVHPAPGSSPADRSCCRCRAEPLVHYRGTVASLEVNCYAGSLRASPLPGGGL